MKLSNMAVALAGLMLPVSIAQDQKLSIPSNPDQKTAETRIKDTFKDGFGKPSREGKRALAQKLLAQANDPMNSATERYVCLCLARDVAATSVELGIGFSAIEKLDELYQIERPTGMSSTWTNNANAQKAALLESARKSAVNEDEQFLIADAFMKVADSALVNLHPEDAASAAELGAKGSKAPGLTLRAKEILRDVPFIKQDMEAMKKSEISLAVDPTDPAANLAKGRYLLFLKKDFDGGLTALSKGSDVDLRELAKKELSKPASADAMAEVAEAWLAFASKAKGLDKKRSLERSLTWFDSALQGTGGLGRAKIEKRLTLVEQAVADADPNTRGMSVDGLIGWWKLDDGYGEKVTDSSRSRNHGTRSAGTTWGSGRVGGGLRLDGTAGQVTFSAAPYKSVTDTFTMAIWVKPAGEAAFAVYPTHGQGTWGGVDDAGVGIAVGPGGVRVIEHTSVYVRSDVEYVTPIKDWTHVAVVYEKKVPRLYVNGKLVKTGAASLKVVHPGGDLGKPGPNYNSYFSGQLDDFRIYNRLLAEAEIRSLSGQK